MKFGIHDRSQYFFLALTMLKIAGMPLENKGYSLSVVRSLRGGVGGPPALARQKSPRPIQALNFSQEPYANQKNSRNLRNLKTFRIFIKITSDQEASK